MTEGMQIFSAGSHVQTLLGSNLFLQPPYLLACPRSPPQSPKCYFQPPISGVWCCNDFVLGKFAACSRNVALLTRPLAAASSTCKEVHEENMMSLPKCVICMRALCAVSKEEIFQPARFKYSSSAGFYNHCALFIADLARQFIPINLGLHAWCSPRMQIHLSATAGGKNSQCTALQVSLSSALVSFLLMAWLIIRLWLDSQWW